MKNICPTEAEEQRALFGMCAALGGAVSGTLAALPHPERRQPKLCRSGQPKEAGSKTRRSRSVPCRSFREIPRTVHRAQAPDRRQSVGASAGMDQRAQQTGVSGGYMQRRERGIKHDNRIPERSLA